MKRLSVEIFLCMLASALAASLVNVSVQAEDGSSPVPQVTGPTGFSPCKNRVNIPEEDMHWLYVPESAGELYSEADLTFLAGQLIKNGGVDASSCPAGGLGIDGYANACGLAVTRPYTIQIQNAFDQAIMDAWVKTGVPPVMLKQLIRYESQFWPGSWGLIHYGLGHLTYMGAITGLTWSNTLRNEMCALDGDCQTPFIEQHATTLLSVLNAYCPDCPLGIDLPKAQRSIYYLAEVLLGYCYQASQVVFNASGITSGDVVDYATIWKLTLFDYNAGPMCVYQAVKEAYDQNRTNISWWNIVYYVDSDLCRRGAAYVQLITQKYYAFPPK